MSLRDEIAEIVYGEHHKDDITWQNCRPKADKILALPAMQELVHKADQWDALGYVTAYVKPDRYEEFVRKAGLWDKVVEIASYVERDGCKDCPLDNTCDRSISMCNLAYALIDTLTGEGEG